MGASLFFIARNPILVTLSNQSYDIMCIYIDTSNIREYLFSNLEKREYHSDSVVLGSIVPNP